MSQVENEKETKTIFQASLHVFVPLKQIRKAWKEDFANNSLQVVPDQRIRNTEAELWYWELQGRDQGFSYRYCVVQKGSGEKEVLSRQVTLRLFLVKFISKQLNPEGRYYLVIGTGIDKNFSDGTPCNDKDLIYLKKAFYERGDAGLHCQNVDATNFHDWLNSLVEQIGGYNPKDHFNRHYVANIKAAKGDFDYEYNEGEPKRYEEVIDDADRFAYALLYGNDNIDVVPDKTIEEAFRHTFTNNISQKMFAANKTIVFFKTHSDPHCCYNDDKEPAFDANFGTALNVFDILFVIEAKFKLKEIQKMVQGFHPFLTKKVLASISGYMNVNPFHLAEIKKRTDYLYEALGVNALFQTVKAQGMLQSESSTAQLTHKLNTKVFWLTVLTVLLAALQLLVSILCCNNPNNSSDMCNCFFGGTEFQGGCCAVVGCLLFIVLAASIINMAVYQVKSFYKLKDIENEIKQLQ